MRLIPIAAVANQSFSATIDNVRYDVALKTARGVAVCDIAVNGVTILTGSRVLSGEMLIPYRYMETGNFILVTVDDELPYWTEFGATQQLYFFTQAELGQLRG